MEPLLTEIVRVLGASGPDKKGWYTALCPFHEDRRHPNLRVREKGFRCMTCGAKGPLRVLAEKVGVVVDSRSSEGLRTADLAKAKGVPEDFLRSLGVSDGYVQSGGRRSPCVRIPYLDETGQVIAERQRLCLDGARRFQWRRGDHPAPYGLWRLDEARKAGYLVVVEGESDSWTLWYNKIPAIGLPGASTWRTEYARRLDGLTPYVWKEPDQGGSTLLQMMRPDLPDLRVILAPPDAKDPSALYLRAPTGFSVAWKALMDSARTATEMEQEARTALVGDLYRKAGAALEDPAILHRLVLATEALGHVDDRQNVAALHLVVISRLSRRPISVVVKGPSSEGKSHLVHGVVEVHPESAAHILSAMSEHALAYSQVPLAHRFLVLEEGAALDSRFGTYLVRSLLSEGRLKYETVEKTKDGLRPRLIQRDGPTGLISTTTAHSLEAETETRVLALQAKEESEHVRQVLLEIAKRRNRGEVQSTPESLTSALEWLELAGEKRIALPFAEWLAEQLPVKGVAPRLMRDFDSLLAMIEASAMLHQRQRGHDDRGRIIATVADYAIAVAVIGEAFELASGESVTPRQREVYEIVDAHDGVSVRVVAEDLEMHPSNASRHLRALTAKGFLANSTDEKGRPACYRAVEPLPEERRVLPTVQDMAAKFPSLTVNYVDPMTGLEAACTAPPDAPQHRNGSDERPMESEGATPTATPQGLSASEEQTDSVAVLRSDTEGTPNIPPWGRRRYAL